MRFICLSLLILFSGCSSIKEVIHPNNMEITNGISNLIKNIIHVGSYTPGMDSGETFVYLLPFGVPFSINDIAPLQQNGNAILENLKAIDKLYIASQLTDQIFFCDSTVHLSTQKLANIEITDKELYKLSSPTFNGSFLCSTIYPLISDSTFIWNSFNHQAYKDVTIQKGKNILRIPVPHLKANGEFMTLFISRPWLYPANITQYYPNKKIAIIEGLILINNFQITVMHEKCKIRIYKKKKYKIISNPISSHINYPNSIIGYYCRIL